MEKVEKHAWLRALDGFNVALAGVASIVLVLMVVLVFVGVVARYALARPILGVNEVVELAAVALVMLALPSCTASGGHVTVDVLDDLIGPIGRFIGDVVSRLASAGVVAILVERATLKALEAREYGDAANMLGIPVWPFYAAVALGMALCAIVLLVQLAVIVWRRRPA